MRLDDALDAPTNEGMSIPDIEKSLASNGKRFANLIVDRLIIYLLIFTLSTVLGVIGFYNEIIFALGETFSYYLLFFIVNFGYFGVFEGMLNGKTIGKYMTKTRVVNEQGTEPDLSQAFLRSICRFIPFDAFSFLESHPRGWHDSLSKTYVIED